jgi:hypothetical protein
MILIIHVGIFPYPQGDSFPVSAFFGKMWIFDEYEIMKFEMS